MGQFHLPLATCLCALLALGGCAPHRSVGHADAPPPVILESSLLRAEAGFTGNRLGVEVDAVTPLDGQDLQAVDLSVPLAAGRIDRVDVLAPSGEIIEQPAESRIDPGPGEQTGIRIFLPGSKRIQFRLRLIDLPEDN